jgi:endoglucanase
VSRLGFKLGLALALAVAIPAPAEDYWHTTRRGANLFDRTESADRLRAAAAAHIEFVRVAPNKWPAAGRDFLLGDADAFTTIPPADLTKVRAMLDWAQAAGVRVVVTTLSLPGARWRQHNGNKSDFRLWREPKYADQAEAFWRQLATALKGHPALAGYNLVNEPHAEQIGGGVDFWTFDFDGWRRRVARTPPDMNALYARLVHAIREVDVETPVILDCGVYATPWAMPGLATLEDPRVLYSFHMYEPYVYTTQKLNRGRFTYPGDVPDEGDGTGPRRAWNASTLRKFFEPVRKWQAAHQVPANRVLVGEFGVDRRSKGAAGYLSDLVEIFEAEGWHWAFYSFREDTWDAMDYELGDGPTPPGFWEALEKGRSPTFARRDNLLFDVLKNALARTNPPSR